MKIPVNSLLILAGDPVASDIFIDGLLSGSHFFAG
jgi:hypothetical protein